ncbi:MAG: hypothetical protein LUM44_19075 [Pyrinomonadaceae bacterium]|nr:hypothetical protein [Pyrinomonadaceae bacterium]
MKKLLFLLLLLSVTALFGNAQTNENRDEKQLFIEAVRFLEENPLGEKSVETRKWALKYSQGVDAPTCDQLLFLFFPKEVRGEVMSQYMMKVAAFELEQTGKKYNVNDAHVAGLESALKVYEKIIEKEPGAKYKKLDSLVQLKNKNQLGNFVKNSNCK